MHAVTLKPNAPKIFNDIPRNQCDCSGVRHPNGGGQGRGCPLVSCYAKPGSKILVASGGLRRVVSSNGSQGMEPRHRRPRLKQNEARHRPGKMFQANHVPDSGHNPGGRPRRLRRRASTAHSMPPAFCRSSLILQYCLGSEYIFTISGSPPPPHAHGTLPGNILQRISRGIAIKGISGAMATPAGIHSQTH